jgi:hypothetical protein
MRASVRSPTGAARGRLNFCQEGRLGVRLSPPVAPSLYGPVSKFSVIDAAATRRRGVRQGEEG